MENDKKTAAATDDVAALQEKINALEADKASLQAENEALKVVGEATTVAEEVTKAVKLSEKQREFTAKWEIPNPADKTKPTQKSGKFRLLDVPKIHLSGKKYTQEEFMASKELQSIAAKMNHRLITELK